MQEAHGVEYLSNKTTIMENALQTGFLDESPNTKSEMRLKSFMLLIFFIVYHLPFGIANAYSVYQGKPIASLSDSQLWFDVIILAFVFIPKVAQKIIELKFAK